MAHRIEFYRFSLNPKTDQRKTFRDYAIEVLGARKTANDEAIFKVLYKKFMGVLEAQHAKDEKKKQTITIIKKRSLNPFIDIKPTPDENNFIISGVINGGFYDKDAIVSDLKDKEDGGRIERHKSVLLPYFIFVYIPPDHDEGIFMFHSNSSAESIKKVFTGYMRKLFAGKGYKHAKCISFCPQKFQDEFRNGAFLKSMSFATSVVQTVPSDDPIIRMINEFDIQVVTKPKTEGAKIPMGIAEKFYASIKDSFLNLAQSPFKLSAFSKKKVTAKNNLTNKEKVFEWSAREDEFVPVVYLDDKIDLTDGNIDFEELREYAYFVFDEYILSEVRPDFNVTEI